MKKQNCPEFSMLDKKKAWTNNIFCKTYHLADLKKTTFPIEDEMSQQVSVTSSVELEVLAESV